MGRKPKVTRIIARFCHERKRGKWMSDYKDKLLLWAEHYTRHGLRLLPLPHGDKRPVMEAWPGRASKEYDVVASWIKNGYPRRVGGSDIFQTGGLGIATGQGSGVIVLDVDGEAGKSTLRELIKQYGEIPRTPIQKTPGGGYHVFFKSWGPCKNRAGMLDKEGLKGLDVRGDGGQVVACPSLHPNGKAYEWFQGGGLDDFEIAECPGWLKAIIEGEKAEGATALHADSIITEGSRDSTLTSLAGTMKKRNMSEAEIEAALLVANRNRCKPPLPEAQVRKIAHSIGRKELQADAVQTMSAQNTAADKTMLLTLRKTLDPDIELPPLHMVGGLFPKGYLSAVIAASGVGKTWFFQRWVSDLSMGGSVFDGFVHSDPLKSLVMAGEGGYELLIRRAREMRWPVRKENVVIYSLMEAVSKGVSFDLGTTEGQGNVRNVLDMDSPEVLIVDTLTAFHSVDENKSSDMKPIFEFLLRQAKERDMAVVLSHHTRKRKLAESKLLMTQDEAIGSSIFNRLAAVIVGIQNIAGWDDPAGANPRSAVPMKNLVRIQKAWFKNPAPFTYGIRENESGHAVMDIDLAPKIGIDPRGRVREYLERTYTFDEWFKCKDISAATGVSERTVRSYLADMANRGILKKQGQNKTMEYAIAGTYAQKLKALQEIPDTGEPIADKSEKAVND
jgi:hypothetical protein